MKELEGIEDNRKKSREKGIGERGLVDKIRQIDAICAHSVCTACNIASNAFESCL